MSASNPAAMMKERMRQLAEAKAKQKAEKAAQELAKVASVEESPGAQQVVGAKVAVTSSADQPTNQPMMGPPSSDKGKKTVSSSKRRDRQPSNDRTKRSRRGDES